MVLEEAAWGSAQRGLAVARDFSLRIFYTAGLILYTVNYSVLYRMCYKSAGLKNVPS